jgi:type IV secretory pathway VirB10-like protein
MVLLLCWLIGSIQNWIDAPRLQEEQRIEQAQQAQRDLRDRQEQEAREAAEAKQAQADRYEREQREKQEQLRQEQEEQREKAESEAWSEKYGLDGRRQDGDPGQASGEARQKDWVDKTDPYLQHGQTVPGPGQAEGPQP